MGAQGGLDVLEPPSELVEGAPEGRVRRHAQVTGPHHETEQHVAKLLFDLGGETLTDGLIKLVELFEHLHAHRLRVWPVEADARGVLAPRGGELQRARGGVGGEGGRGARGRFHDGPVSRTCASGPERGRGGAFLKGVVVANEAEVQRFGEYELVELIAVGGMAEVWRARVQGLAGFQKTLVVKKILDSLARDQEFLRLFIDEARIAVMLQHHNIVQVFDLATVDGTLYMAMEYVQGEDLSKILKRTKDQDVPVELALFIAGEVLKALRFAHERRDDQGRLLSLVHCDISPQNVLISQAGEVKITDFGISRAAFQAASLHDTVRGKYAYMSPEQIENRELDHRSDLFSLGIVLWETLTGKRLFKGKNKDDTLARVKRAEVPSPRLYRPSLSEDVEAFLLKALARQPDQRFDDATSMLDALGLLMVREGYRATNNDLASFLQELGPEGGTGGEARKIQTSVQTLVVVAAEPRAAGGAVWDGRSVAEDWGDQIARRGGEVWEKERGGVLAVWRVDKTLREAVDQICPLLVELDAQVRELGGVLAAGVAPGKARVFDDTRRPGRGWELQGPFQLARWLMNRSPKAGAVLVSGVVAGALPGSSTRCLGWLSRAERERVGVWAWEEPGASAR